MKSNDLVLHHAIFPSISSEQLPISFRKNHIKNHQTTDQSAAFKYLQINH